jgi:UDP-glucose 4-epimerase
MILVTGASGRLGQWVVAALTARGDDVLTLSRRPRDAPTISGLTWSRPISNLRCDLTDPADVARVRPRLTDVTAVVHLATYIPEDTAVVSTDDAVATLRANVDGSVRLLGALDRSPNLRTVVLSSTFEVYGPPLKLPVDETHPTRPASHYGASKLLAEKCLALFQSDRGVPCSSLRMPAIYGPGDTIRRALGNFVKAAVAGDELLVAGDGADLRELLYLGDAAEAIIHALDRRASGAFNIASGVGYSIREMAETVVQAAGGGSIAVAPRTKGRVDYVMDVGRAREALDWRPTTSLGEGVSEMLTWARAERDS